MPSLTIRKFDEKLDNKEDLIDLLKPIFKNTWQIISRKWEWQYLKNPFCDAPSVYVALYDNNIAGAIGCIPIKISIHGKVVDAAWMIEAVTNPAYQRMGISMKLHAQIEEDFTLVLAKSISDMILPLTRKRNYIYIPNAVYMLRILNFKSFFRSWLSKTTSKRNKNKRRKRSYKNVAGIEIVKHFNQEYDDFAESLRSKYEFTVLRTSEYLQWRYFDCPVVNYTAFKLTSNGKIAGYVVLRISNDKGIRCGWIVDMLVDPMDSNSFNRMLKKCMLYFKSNDVSCVYALGTHRLLKKNYYRNFFFPTKTHARIMAKNENGSLDLCSDANLWYIAEGDSDSDLFKKIIR